MYLEFLRDCMDLLVEGCILFCNYKNMINKHMYCVVKCDRIFGLLNIRSDTRYLFRYPVSRRILNVVSGFPGYPV